jgi:hypothetical protein
LTGEPWFTYAVGIMSREDLIKNIQSELQNLNAEIDLKIIKGFPYRRESKRHRFLLSQFTNLTQVTKNNNWLEKASSILTTFIF